MFRKINDVQMVASHLCPLWELVRKIGFTPIGQARVAKGELFLIQLGFFWSIFTILNGVLMVASHLCPSWELVKTICTVSFAFLKLENGW